MTIPRRILASLILFVAVTAMGQSWPPDTFRWFYHDSIPTKELKARAKAGDPIAINDYAASLYRTGKTADEMIDRSMRWWRKGAEAGAPRSQLFLVHDWSYKPESLDTKKQMMENVYDSDDADAVCFMAEMLTLPYTRIPDKYDKTKIVRYYRRAAELGSAKAKRVLAEFSVFGGELTRDWKGKYSVVDYSYPINIDSAYIYLVESNTFDGDRFNSWAMKYYTFGSDSLRLVADKPEIAARMFEILINHYEKHENIFPSYTYSTLADLYYNRLHDYDKAFRLYKRIADEEKEYVPNFIKSIAYERLARCYRFGRGTDEDQQLANKYHNKALTLRNDNAKEYEKYILTLQNADE